MKALKLLISSIIYYRYKSNYYTVVSNEKLKVFFVHRTADYIYYLYKDSVDQRLLYGRTDKKEYIKELTIDKYRQVSKNIFDELLKGE